MRKGTVHRAGQRISGGGVMGGGPEINGNAVLGRLSCLRWRLSPAGPGLGAEGARKAFQCETVLEEDESGSRMD